MGTFSNKFDLGDRVSFKSGSNTISGKVSGMSAVRKNDDTYNITYQIFCEDENKTFEVKEEDCNI